MVRYLGKRLLESLIAIIGVTLVVFLLLYIVGDPVDLMLSPNAGIEEMEALKERLGYNDPLPVQYLRFLGNALHGDFGMSYNYKLPAWQVVRERIPATLTLTLSAFAITILVGIQAGILAAVFRNRLPDMLIRTFALLGQCVPSFWLGIMLMLIFAVRLHLVPTSGFTTWSSLWLPALTLGLSGAAGVARMLRSGMLEVLGREYMDTARAKGLYRPAIILKHALKNALSSILTILGLQLAGLMGGSVITETVFAWPGIGRLLVQSIEKSDFMVVEVIVLIMASAFVLINFLVDMLYCVINPRIRLQ